MLFQYRADFGNLTLLYFRLNLLYYAVGSLNFFEARTDLLAAINLVLYKFWKMNDRIHVDNCSGFVCLGFFWSVPLDWNSCAAPQRNVLSCIVIYDFFFFHLTANKLVAFKNYFFFPTCVFFMLWMYPSLHLCATQLVMPIESSNMRMR